MKSRLIYTALAILGLTAGAGAQKVEILGFTSGMRSSQIKAKVDLGGKTLTGVTAYSYRMSDGAHADSNVYSLVEAGDGSHYLSANVDTWSGAYEYFQVRLDFSDGTHYMTECINPELTDAFFWLGDVPMTKAKSGWDDQHPPVVDGSVDPGYKMTLDGVIYYKGVSNHAPGEMEFNLAGFTLPEKYSTAGGFKKFNTLIGVQDEMVNGSVEFVFTADGTEKFRKSMYSKANAARKEAPCVADVEFSLDEVSLLNIQAGMSTDGVNWGDHAQHALARLYLSMPERERKDLPTLSFNQETDTLKGAINLSAALSGATGTVYYSIVSGGDCATLSGSTLKPVWGKKGEVVVEATYYGDESHQPASAYTTYYVDLTPHVEILELYQSADPAVAHRGYLLVDTKGAGMTSLTVKAFDNHDTLNEVATISLSGKMKQGVVGPQIVPFEIAGGKQAKVLVLNYQYEGQPEVTTSYWEDGENFDYMSDLPFTSQVGWGVIRVNEAYRDNSAAPSPLRIGNEPTEYKKGFGMHAAGYVESQADLSKYDRFAMHIGGQPITNPTRAANIIFGLQNGATALVEDTKVPWTTRLDWDTPVNNGENIRLRINVKTADNNNTNNVVAIASPRLYYYPVSKPAQTIEWEREKVIRINAPASYTLDATSTSALTPDYRVISGMEYASISGNTLSISKIPSDGSVDIVVESYQPGNAVWGAAPAVTQTYRLIRGLEVARDETVAIKSSQILDEVIVHADRESSGQIRVDKGVVNVRKLILKYKFVPGEWSYIAFPSSADLTKISDFAEKGLVFNNEFGPAYYVQTLTPGVDPSDPASWVSLENPTVEGMKGYAMGIANTGSTDPVEITFTLDNVGLDLTDHERPMSATLDLSGMRSGSQQTVSVTPDNVEGATLNVVVTYNPSDLSAQPLDYGRALSEARCTFSEGRKGMRITLPDSTPARVAFFDESGKKMVKAVRYISPQSIDISRLKKGIYNVAVEYGNATRIFTIEI